MQQHFWALFGESVACNPNLKQAEIYRARIGAGFLRRYRELLNKPWTACLRREHARRPQASVGLGIEAKPSQNTCRRISRNAP